MTLSNNVGKKQPQDNSFLKFSTQGQKNEGVKNDSNSIWGGQKAGATKSTTATNPFDKSNSSDVKQEQAFGQAQEKNCNEYFGNNGEFDQETFYDDTLGLNFGNSSTKKAGGSKENMQQLNRQINIHHALLNQANKDLADAQSMPDEIQTGTNADGTPIMQHNYMKDYAIGDAQSNIAETETKLQQMQSEYNSLEAQQNASIKNSFTSSNTDTQKSVGFKLSDEEKIGEDFKTNSNNVSSTTNDNSSAEEIQSEIDELETSIDKNDEQIEYLEGSIEHMEEDKSSLEDKANEFGKEIDDCNKEIANQEAIGRQQSNIIMKQDSVIKDLQNSITTIDAQIAEFEASNDQGQFSAQISALRSQQQELMAKKCEAESKKQEAENKREEAYKAIDEAKDKKDKATENKNLVENNIKEMEQVINDTKSELETLKSDTDNMRNRLNDAQDRLKNAQNDKK
ncbi:MAG: hypothetical protein MJ180_02725 [Candidatus Gastranaerophilales bacterium]|nr:hypothetical protein [Candidatus Gastranaerophilales bacterium]